MNWSKVWFAVSLVGVASLIFVLGFSFGNRIWFSTAIPTTITTTQWNGAIATVLESIKSVPLLARSSSQETKTVGQLTFISRSNKIELVIKLDSVPLTFNLADKQISTPQNLKIYRVSKSADGLDYISNQVGTITLEQVGTNLAGFFSTIVELPNTQTSIERLIFLSESGTSDIPPAPALEFLPSKQQIQNAPYVWSEKLDKAK